MKEVKCISKLSRIAGFKEEFTYLEPKKIKTSNNNNNNLYRVTPPQKKTEPINFFITSTKIKQNNSNFVYSNFWTCWWILLSQFFMHRIYFISCKKKEKARIKFMNFSQKYMGSAFLGGSLCTTDNFNSQKNWKRKKFYHSTSPPPFCKLADINIGKYF